MPFETDHEKIFGAPRQPGQRHQLNLYQQGENNHGYYHKDSRYGNRQ
jgi:hypothetical protein